MTGGATSAPGPAPGQRRGGADLRGAGAGPEAELTTSLDDRQGTPAPPVWPVWRAPAPAPLYLPWPARLGAIFRETPGLTKRPLAMRMKPDKGSPTREDEKFDRPRP